MQELIEIQSTLIAKKNQRNDYGGYFYRNTEDILEALKPLLKKLDCILIINDEVIQVGDRYYIKATATISKGEKSISSSSFAREPISQKGMNESQITGSASSYARKYALNALFAIDDVKDADTLNNRAEIMDRITGAEFNNIKKLVVEAEADLSELNKTFQIETLREMRRGHYDRACELLEIKIAKKFKEEAKKKEDDNLSEIEKELNF